MCSLFLNAREEKPMITVFRKKNKLSFKIFLLMFINVVMLSFVHTSFSQIKSVEEKKNLQVQPRLKLKANVPASYYRLKDLLFGKKTCLQAAEQTLKKTSIGKIKIFNIKKGNSEVSGMTFSTRGYIVCVSRPKAGACNKEGSTAVMVGAGPDAKQMVDNLNNNFPNIVPFDC